MTVAKVADRYFTIDPWRVVEDGFDAAHGRTAESVFSLGNEYMGVRGYFDEGYSGDRLVGVYLNGIFEESPGVSSHYRGISDRMTYMVNTVDWLATRVEVDGERLDLATSAFSDYVRTLDMRSGLLTRSFTWTTRGGKCLRLTFQRALSMLTPALGGQRVILEAVNFSGEVVVRSGLDFSILHETWGASQFTVMRSEQHAGIYGALGQTKTSRHTVYAGFLLQPAPPAAQLEQIAEPFFGARFTLELRQGEPVAQDKLVYVHSDKDRAKVVAKVWSEAALAAQALIGQSFDRLVAANERYWADMWDTFDIAIEGDAENLQGIRYCMFQLMAILLQQGRGGDIASAFGGSGSQTAFGARAGATLLTRVTTVTAVLLIIGAIGLGILWQRGGGSSVVSGKTAAPVSAPTAPAPVKK